MAGSAEEEKTMTEGTPLIPRGASVKIVPSVAVGTLSTLYNDKTSEMTWSRKFARYLSRFSWYYPKAAQGHASLDDAWAYFEHFTLSRYHDQDQNKKDQFYKAEPGEQEMPTKLYPVLATPEKDLADFGVGVGVYFLTLRAMAIIMFLAGLIAVPNLWYFGSDEYNSSHEFSRYQVLRSSAICTDQQWKPCPTCEKSNWDYFPVSFDRYAEVVKDDGTVLRFTRINNCYISRDAGMYSLIAMVFVCVSVFILVQVTKRKERIFDEAQQTTSDYSVAVRNPPLDSKDPEEWKKFFSQFGDVTVVTIAHDNEELLAKLIQRRRLLSMLEELLPPGQKVDLDDIQKSVDMAMPVAWYWKLLGSVDGPAIQKQLSAIEKVVTEDLSQRTYDVSEVFVTFETEDAQQKCLKALLVPFWQVLFNSVSSVSSNYVFRGTKVLGVEEPAEPTAVRWPDLDETALFLLFQRFITMIVTVFFIALGCAVVIFVRIEYGTVYAALAVSVVTSSAPYVCKYGIIPFESHANEGSRQVSLYFKNTAFLWIVTSLLTAYITPFENTLNNDSDALIPAMYAIFVAEMLTSPLIQVSDMFGNFYRHVLAPRARSQKKMRYYFQGTLYTLAERYTNLTNVLFLTFYYALIFPAGYFLAAATLLIHYWVDKFCLLRVWAPAPAVGSEIAEMSRIYFFSTSLVVFAIVSSFAFSSFPYDNACPLSTPVSEEYVGSFTAETGEGLPVTIDIASDDTVYKFCDQDMAQFKPPAFPATPSNQPEGSEWMDEGQDFAYIYGYTAAAVVAVVVLVVLNRFRMKWQGLIFHRFSSHPSRTAAKRFSEVPDISGYIPSSKIDTEPYPTLFTDISAIDKELIPWVDPNSPDYKVHNAIYDFPGLEEKEIWSTVNHWPPEGTRTIKF